MRALAAALLVAGVIALSGWAGTASAVSFDLSYSDPASDVVKLWTSNETPVLLPGGAWSMSPFPDSVNLLWIRSTNESADVNLTFEVKGDIAVLDNTSYEMRLFTRSDNASHFVVTYTNGTTVLSSNSTGFVPIDITGNSTITSTGPNPTLQNLLRIRVAKILLGTITVWNIDATSSERGPVYTYRDYGWEVPGNPGSTPPAEPSQTGLPTWAWIAIGIGVAGVVAVILVAKRRRRESPPK